MAIKFLATGLYSGLLPKAPGTWGSLAFVVLWMILGSLGFITSPHDAAIIAIATMLIGYVATSLYLKQTSASEESDPKEVVIDEWAGMAVSLIPAYTGNLYFIVGAFFLFRLFDIWKPWPVGRVEKLHGATGVMADDIAAGILAAICLMAFMLVYF